MFLWHHATSPQICCRITLRNFNVQLYRKVIQFKIMQNRLFTVNICQRCHVLSHGLGRLIYSITAYVRNARYQDDTHLMDHRSPVSGVVFRQRLRSASSHQLSVTTLLVQHVRSSDVFCCWPDCLELIARRPSESGVLC